MEWALRNYVNAKLSRIVIHDEAWEICVCVIYMYMLVRVHMLCRGRLEISMEGFPQLLTPYFLKQGL